MTQSELESYLLQRYGLVRLGSLAKKRLQEAYESNLNVTPDRLLQCWRTMESYLNNERAKAMARGTRLTGDELLRYDLAIVLSKYDRFMRSILSAERDAELSKDIVEMHEIAKNISKSRKQPQPRRPVRDISGLLGEDYDVF